MGDGELKIVLKDSPPPPPLLPLPVLSFLVSGIDFIPSPYVYIMDVFVTAPPRHGFPVRLNLTINHRPKMSDIFPGAGRRDISCFEMMVDGGGGTQWNEHGISKIEKEFYHEDELDNLHEHRNILKTIAGALSERVVLPLLSSKTSTRNMCNPVSTGESDG